MSKIVKLKQSDVVRLVKNIIKEEMENMDMSQSDDSMNDDSEACENPTEIAMAKDEQGNVYILANPSGDEPEIVLQTK